ncbi:hypothetical protein GCM10027422_48950 [Hymenobacter arcticus]
MFARPFFNRALAMTICECCGRVHQATEIDRRFCSLMCRNQYDERPIFYQPAALLEAQRQQGQLLRSYVSTILKAAGQFLHQAETLTPEQQLANQHAWLTTIAAQEKQILSLSDVFAVDVPYTPPPTAE